MKKVLFILLASFLSFGTAQAVDYSVGVGLNSSVFAATGKEENYNETGGGLIVTEEYGAFASSYPSVFAEVGNEVGSLGISYQGGFDTPTNVNDQGANSSVSRTTVSASFKDFMTVYAKLNVPLGGLYIKAGYSQVDVLVNEVTESGNKYPDVDLNGYVVAIGYDFEMDAFDVRLEVQGHAFDDVSVNNGLAADVNSNTVTISDMIGATGSLQLVKTF